MKNANKDELLQRIRVTNLVSPLNDLSHAELAGTLCAVNPDLATLIACYELETLIRKFAKLNCPNLTLPEPNSYLPKLSKVIKGLFKGMYINYDRKERWMTLKDARDDFFHKGIIPIDKMTDLIEEITKLEKELS